MRSFKIISADKASMSIDTNLYSNNVIHKVLYWLSGSYVINTTSCESFVSVELSSKESTTNWQATEETISQMLCDFSLREVIAEETKDIRNILYIKAFSNLDDFYEYESTDR